MKTTTYACDGPGCDATTDESDYARFGFGNYGQWLRVDRAIQTIDYTQFGYRQDRVANHFCSVDCLRLWLDPPVETSGGERGHASAELVPSAAESGDADTSPAPPEQSEGAG